MSRIIIFGLAGAGKDTVAEMLKKHFPAAITKKFAGTIKKVAGEVFEANFDGRDVKEVATTLNLFQVYSACGMAFRDLWQDPEMRDKAMKQCIKVLVEYDPDDTGYIRISPRKFQQLLGTEIVRHVEDAAWVNATKAETTGDDLFIITDGRFENEIFSKEDKLVYVFRTKTQTEINALKGHSSEEFNVLLYNKAILLDTSTELEHNGNKFYILDNLTDFEELELNVRDFVEAM